MTRFLRISFILPLLLALVIGGVPAAARAESALVTGIRHSSGQGHTRIVLDMTREARYTKQVLLDPVRFVIDVEANLKPGLGPLVVDDAIVSRVRVGTAEESPARLVIDLKSKADYRVLDVPADATNPHRIVIDFFAAAKAPAPAAHSGSGGPVTGTAVPPRTVPNPVPRREAAGPYVIVVDAGHGGTDPGARGFKLEEKDVCLEVARKVVNELNARPGFKAHLSRDGDYFIPLRKRIEIAEKHDADAFVSIHANASKSRSAHGTEVFFLSLSGATDEASRELAHLENSADLMGGVAPEADDDLSSILFDMQQTDVLQRASLLAESVVNSLRGHTSLSTRGVKQAGFVVLKSPRIPSILVETAFITNPSENKLLARSDFRQAFARRVADGVVKFFENVSVADIH
jgi:N-acetylmuramoyl-L-alanine amidase